MGVFTTILKSWTDTAKPSTKCYAGTSLKFHLVDIHILRSKSRKELLPTEKRLLQHELAGKEPIKKYFVLESRNKNNQLTLEQVKEIFCDMGFHVDPIMSKQHGEDFAAIMSIHGYVIPGWHWLCKKIFRISPKLEKLFLTKLAPGKERLHIRASQNNDKTWIITAHTDINWFHPNLFKAIHAHTTEGTGDYVTGTRLMEKILKKYIECLKKDKPLTFTEIERIRSLSILPLTKKQ